MRGVVVVLLGLCGCSFSIAAQYGSQSVRNRHEVADAVLGIAPSVVCGVAVVAAVDPDGFAPVPDDITSWESLDDRAGTAASGRRWAAISCPVAAGLFLSALYGHFAKPSEPSSNPDFGLMAAAFAQGLLPPKDPDLCRPGQAATALCNDGKVSCSMNRAGTCSWHRGVYYWY